MLEKVTASGKTLKAVAKGIPIVSLEWLHQSVAERTQLDFDKYKLDWSSLLKRGKKLPEGGVNLFKGNFRY